MSLYADYLYERTGDLINETQAGFITYRYLNEKQVYIVDIYVKPEHRRANIASLMADEVVKEARSRGCTEVLGTVAPSAKGSTLSLKVLLGYGMSLHSSGVDFIICKKDI